MIISEDQALQRIDNFLFRIFKKVPKSHLYKMVRQGNIKVNKKKVKPGYRLQEKDVLSFPRDFLAEKEQITSIKPSKEKIELLERSILYEDENLLVLNKPAGIAVHGGSGLNFGVIEVMRQARPRSKSLELAHRLDRDTSGCLMIAKKRTVLRELHRLQREGKIEKTYFLIVRGKWRWQVRKIETLLVKNKLRSGERMVKIDDSGKKAVTIFNPLKIFKDRSLLEAKLGSGRTHQIRVQAAYLGYPIVGDEKYGDKKFNAEMRAKGTKRLLLHAFKLQFSFNNGFLIKITAPQPEEFKI